MHPKLKRYVDTAKDLPSIPSVAARVMEMVEDPEVSVDDLRKVIETDPGLSTRILKVVNSSLYSFGRPIETVNHAVTLLGLRTVRNLILAASLKQTFRSFGLSEKLLWEHSVLSGPAAARLSRHCAVGIDREEAFTAGLLHDLGKIALNNSSPADYAQVFSRVYNEGASFLQAERDIFGFDHAELGGHVATKWKLSSRLVNVIQHHHEADVLSSLPVEDARLTALATVTTACCTRLGVGRRESVVELDPTQLPAWSFLGLEDHDLEPVLDAVSEEAKKAEDLLA